VPQGVLLALALIALVLLPCLVALLVINVDRWPRPRPRRRRRSRMRRITPQGSSWQERWMLIRLERALAAEPAEQRVILDAMSESSRPSIERIASDLRRLARHRLGVATRNPVWHEAVRQAYDDRLRLACGCLGIQQHLIELDGLDLEIERVRVEGELRAAGLAIGATDGERRQGHGRDRR
jgi:hypothetical protein